MNDYASLRRCNVEREVGEISVRCSLDRNHDGEHHYGSLAGADVRWSKDPKHSRCGCPWDMPRTA